MTEPQCVCGDYWLDEGHPPDCPVQQRIDGLRAEVERLRNERDDAVNAVLLLTAPEEVGGGIAEYYRAEVARLRALCREAAAAMYDDDLTEMEADEWWARLRAAGEGE